MDRDDLGREPVGRRPGVGDGPRRCRGSRGRSGASPATCRRCRRRSATREPAWTLRNFFVAPIRIPPMSIVSSDADEERHRRVADDAVGRDRGQPPQALAGQPRPLRLVNPSNAIDGTSSLAGRRYRDPCGILAIGRARPPGTRSLDRVTTRFVIIGGGPAGNTAATYAARLGAEVTMVERDVVGGAAHLWDCIPSKTMIATGGAMAFLKRSAGMGLEAVLAEVDTDALSARIEGIKDHLQAGTTSLLASQGVRMIRGTARFVGPYEVEVDGVEGTVRVPFDAALIATGSRPRIPDWCAPDGDRILTTRDCYPPKIFPESRHRHRLRRDRRGVRPHVLVVRRPGHAGRVPPAGAAGQGPRGGGGAGGRLPAPRRAAAQGRPGHRHRPRGRRGRRALRRRAGRALDARRAGHRVGAQHATASASRPPA